jgi:hypothetical protein
MTLAGVYSFWKYVSKLERRETRRYLEMFYILKYRDLVSDTDTTFLCILVGVPFITCPTLLFQKMKNKLCPKKKDEKQIGNY